MSNSIAFISRGRSQNHKNIIIPLTVSTYYIFDMYTNINIFRSRFLQYCNSIFYLKSCPHLESRSDIFLLGIHILFYSQLNNLLL